MLQRLLNRRIKIKHDTFLINNNRRFPLMPEIDVLNLKRKQRVTK